jgi:hypothetical protein
VDSAEEELRRRGIYGYDKPIYYNGDKVGSATEYSDACLIFYLKGRRQDVFRERMEHSGPGGGPLQYIDLSNIPVERLEQMRQWIVEASVEAQPAIPAVATQEDS